MGFPAKSRIRVPRHAVSVRRGERGTSVLEFALVALPMLFMMLGVVVIGLDLGQAVQVAQIARDADSMYSRGVDFTQTSAQNFLIQLGQNMNLQSGSGNGLITLSEIQSVPVNGCASPCNSYKDVLVQRITIGNTGITDGATRFPTAGTVTYTQPTGAGCACYVANYTTDNNAIVTNFSSTITLQPNAVTFVAEAYFQPLSVSLGSIESVPGIYSQAFF